MTDRPRPPWSRPRGTARQGRTPPTPICSPPSQSPWLIISQSPINPTTKTSSLVCGDWEMDLGLRLRIGENSQCRTTDREGVLLNCLVTNRKLYFAFSVHSFSPSVTSVRFRHLAGVLIEAQRVISVIHTPPRLKCLTVNNTKKKKLFFKSFFLFPKRNCNYLKLHGKSCSCVICFDKFKCKLIENIF